MREILVRPVVCVLVMMTDADGCNRILVQKRTKKQLPVDYYGYWELPQGKVRSGETIFQAAIRETKEETGLLGVELHHTHHIEEKTILGSRLEIFEPTICVIDLDHNYLGVGVILRTIGEIRETSEASDHRWIDEQNALELIDRKVVFPLNIPMLLRFFALSKDRR